MSQGFSSHPNLEFYRKQAKALLRAYREGDESAARRMGHTRDGSAPGLSDAQLAVARETGFASWSSLKAAVLAGSDAATPDAEVEAPADEGIEDVPRAERKGPRPKQRYERDPNVQRWIQSSGATNETDGLATQFLREHRERDWILSSLQGFHAKGLITDVVGVVKAGKEATVYRCVGADGSALAAKIYRPRMFRNLKNDAVYRDARMPDRDRRSRKAMDTKSRHGRTFRMESWLRFELETQTCLFEAGVTVPRPLDSHGNAILMEMIGDGDDAAPMLCNVEMDHEEAARQFDGLMQDVRLMLACDRVHADLSAYNVLYRHGRSVIIDFAQAVDARSGPDVFPMLRRDVDRLARHFSRFGVAAEPEIIALDLWSKYTRGELPRAVTGTAEAGDAP